MSNVEPESEVQEAVLTESEMGDLLVAYLNQLGIEYVFGVPGGAIEPLYNALARSERQGGVRAVVARHETGAAFMADGYARNTGKLGVCCSTTGPGATNMITGVASAYENNVPMLVITAQTAISTFGKGAIQDSSCTGINTVGLYQHCTRYNTLISHPAQFEHKLSAAIMSAMGSPAGPAHISVPRDVMALQALVNGPSYSLDVLLNQPTLIDDNAVASLYEEIVRAKRPVFVVGDEACDAMPAILAVAAEINAQILVTPHGKGLVSPYHPLFKGVIGFAGHISATRLLADPEVDLVVAIGARFGEFSSNAWDTHTLLNNRLVHVESTAANLTRTPMAKLHVRGCLETIFDRIVGRFGIDCSHYIRAVEPKNTKPDLNLVKHFSCDDEAGFCSNATPIKPQRLMRDLPKLFPGNTRFLVDTGNSLAWGTHYLHPFDRRMSGKRDQRGGLFSASVDFASMVADPDVGAESLPSLNKPLKSDSFLQLLGSHFIAQDKPPVLAKPAYLISAPIAPAGYLVVDDSRANQQVAVAMLDKLGCHSEVAHNGREGVEAVSAGQF